MDPIGVCLLAVLTVVVVALVWLVSEEDARSTDTPTQLSFDDLLNDLEQESDAYRHQVHSLFARRR